jgi:hypothetical protein
MFWIIIVYIVTITFFIRDKIKVYISKEENDLGLLSFSLDVQQLMRLEDFSLSGGLSFGTYSLQGQMRSILRLLLLTSRCFDIVSCRLL